MQLLWYTCFIAVLVSVMAAKQPGRARGNRDRGDRDRPPGNRGRRPQDSDEVAGQRPSLGEGGRRGRGRGGELPEFVRMISGRYDNSESLLEVEGMDQEGQGPPRITMSFTPVQINSLRPPVTGIFIQANMGSAPPMINLMTYEPVKQKRGESGYIRNRAWAFRNPDRFVNGWENPDYFNDLDPSDVANEELVPWLNCTHQYRRTENGTFVSNGTGGNCKAPSPRPQVGYCIFYALFRILKLVALFLQKSECPECFQIKLVWLMLLIKQFRWFLLFVTCIRCLDVTETNCYISDLSDD